MRTVGKKKTVRRIIAGFLALVMVCVLAPNLTVTKAADTLDATVSTLGEYGPQDFASRWLFRFGLSQKVEGTEWSTSYQGLSVVVSDGTHATTLTNVEAYACENQQLGVIVPYTSLPAYSELGTGIYKVTLKAGTITSDVASYRITEDFVIEHTSGATFKVADSKPSEGESVLSATVTISNDDRNRAGNTDNGFYFVVSPADPLASDIQNWTTRYGAKEGGIYVEDVLYDNIRIVKVTESLYYVPLSENGVTVKKDMKVKIDGIFGDSSMSVKYLPATFTYDGNGKWTLAGDVQEEPLTQAEYKVYDMYDLLQVSALKVTEDSLFNLTDLKRSTNVALKLHVNRTDAKSDTQDYGFGLSKTVANNLWVDSGYQVKVSPTLGRVLILTNVDQVVATGYSDEVKEAYDLEFGVINMSNTKGKLVARKVYVKVNDVELLSYMDTDLSRTLGTYIPVWCAKNMNLQLESCSKKGYNLVSKTPTIYDISQLNGGLKSSTTKATQCVLIGSTKKSTNMAVKMKVKWNSSFDTYNETRQDEMKFGLAKAGTDTIWDAEQTGWHVALRPNQVLLLTGGEELEANVSYEIPKKEFLLEIGTYDIEIQKNGKKVGSYGRMVYVKIDGVEVVSWLDKDLDRASGNNFLVYTTQTTKATLTSLTSTKYLIRKQNTVADLYDACGLSEVTLNKDNITKLGTLSKKSEIALKMKLQFNKKSDEFKLAISKTVPDNFWDADGSGWQFWFRPASNQIFIGYGVSEPAAVIGYNFQEMKKNNFILEIGERDVVYNTGKSYGREVYIKIDGEDVLSWIDADTKRPLGKYVTAWASLNSEIKLSSLTTKGYVPVDAVANVNDIFDVGQYASVKLTQNECVNLGCLDNFKNQSVKMKVDATKKTDEYKIAIGKVSDTTIWDIEASGWQFWFRPASNQVFIGYGVSEYAEVIGYDFPEQYTLEIGTRNVKMKNGKPYGLRIYVKIDGKEILSWIDTDTNRKVGKNIIAYASANADVTFTTKYATKELPVTYKVNDKEKSSYKLIDTKAIVVPGKDSKMNVTIKKDPAVSLNLLGIYQNQDALGEVSLVKDVHTYLTKKPKSGDKIVIELETKKLRCDSAQIFDFYDVANLSSYKVEAQKDGYIGNVLKENEPGGINTAMRFGVDTPKDGFNQIRLSYLGDNATLWSTSGFIMNLINQKAMIQLSIDQSTLAEGNCEMIQPGKSFVVEVGAVKCYEEELYKYDRWYIKIGKTVEDMELVVWFDSTQRGGYGSSVATYGTDMEGCDFTLRSLKKICTIKDVSAKSEQKKLLTTDRLGEIGYGAYYPESVVSGEKASIKIYTKEGRKLTALKVNGTSVKAKQAEDGSYIYDLGSVTGNVTFSYTVE